MYEYAPTESEIERGYFTQITGHGYDHGQLGQSMPSSLPIGDSLSSAEGDEHSTSGGGHHRANESASSHSQRSRDPHAHWRLSASGSATGPSTGTDCARTE
jgi:hypothetical protein